MSWLQPGRRKPEDRECGVALVLVVFALVVIGGLISLALLLGTRELRLGRNVVEREQAMALAQAGAALEVVGWDRAAYNRLPIGGARGFSGTLSIGSGWFRGTVRRLSDRLFLVGSQGIGAGNRSRQGIGLLVRLDPVSVPLQAALTTAARASPGPLVALGADQSPPGWDCPPPRSPLTDRMADSSASAALWRAVGELSPLATVVLGPGPWTVRPTTSAGACSIGDPANWGDPDDPAGPCGRHLPVVHAYGDLTLSGGRGQGVIIVDGDLRVNGGVRLYGLVAVRGRLTAAGTGGRIWGAVAAEAVQITAPVGVAVRYSSCAVLRALAASAPASRLPERAWVNLPSPP